MERRFRSITPEKKPVPISQTPEFKQAVEVYCQVLGDCGIPAEHIQRQIPLQESTPRKRIMGFISVAEQLKSAPSQRSNKA